jgi:hypothetical protein
LKDFMNEDPFSRSLNFFLEAEIGNGKFFFYHILSNLRSASMILHWFAGKFIQREE